MQELKDKITLQGHVFISDPCYEMDTLCTTDAWILPGTYHCFFNYLIDKRNDKRITAIEIKHEQYLHATASELYAHDIGVDSGICGIFDFDYFKEHQSDDTWQDIVYDTSYTEHLNPQYKKFIETDFYKKHENIYAQYKKNEISDKDYMKHLIEFQKEIAKYSQNEDFSTEFIPETSAGTIDDKCLVSSSGYGDGIYSLYAARNEDRDIVGLKLVFIEEEGENIDE